MRLSIGKAREAHARSPYSSAVGLQNRSGGRLANLPRFQTLTFTRGVRSWNPGRGMSQKYLAVTLYWYESSKNLYFLVRCGDLKRKDSEKRRIMDWTDTAALAPGSASLHTQLVRWIPRRLGISTYTVVCKALLYTRRCARWRLNLTMEPTKKLGNIAGYGARSNRVFFSVLSM